MTKVKVSGPVSDASSLINMCGDKLNATGIQSVERAFAILEHIARARSGVTLSELSKQLEIHTSTVFHLVQTIVALGYVRQTRDSKKYRIGRPLFALAASSDEDRELVSLATPVLRMLSARTGETAHLGVWSGRSILVLARTSVAEMPPVISAAELLRPAYATGLGKALLAAMSDAQLDRYLDGAALTAMTDLTITTQQMLRDNIEEVRRQRVAYDRGECNSDICCAADVVRNNAGHVVCAIGVSGPVNRLGPSLLHDASKSVHLAAADLSAVLGYRGHRSAYPGLQAQHSASPQNRRLAAFLRECKPRG